MFCGFSCRLLRLALALGFGALAHLLEFLVDWVVDARLASIIAAVEHAAPVLEVMLQEEGTAFLALLLLRRIPGRVITVRIVLAAIECAPAARAALDDLAAALRTLDTCIFQERLRVAAFREARAGEELAVASLLDDHQAAAVLAADVRHLYGQFDVADGLVGLLERLLERTVELPQQLVLVDLALGDLIELVLEIGRELDIDDVFEVLLEHVDDDEAELCRLEVLVDALDVTARLDRLDDRRVRARAADLLLLERLDERGIVVARRRLCEVLLRQRLGDVQDIAFFKLRQENVFFLLRRLSTGVNFRETGELEAGTIGAQVIAVAGLDGDCHRVVYGRRHLAGGKALPDERV